MADPLASSPKSTLTHTYVTWVRTTYWLIPIGLFHPYHSFNVCQSPILVLRYKQ